MKTKIIGCITFIWFVVMVFVALWWLSLVVVLHLFAYRVCRRLTFVTCSIGFFALWRLSLMGFVDSWRFFLLKEFSVMSLIGFVACTKCSAPVRDKTARLWLRNTSCHCDFGLHIHYTQQYTVYSNALLPIEYWLLDTTLLELLNSEA